MTNNTRCLIEFDNPQKVYYGGQTINGRVILTLNKEKLVRGISMNITGKAYCRWKEKDDDDDTIKYTGEETYLSEKSYLAGDKRGLIDLAPGVYEYNFRCALPSGLPSSLEGEIGHIRYNALVCLDRPLWPDQEFEESFTVLKPINLNLLNLRNPVEQEKQKTFSYCCCFCCFRTKPLCIIGRLPVGGYIPGETIQLSVRFVNHSPVEMSAFETILRKVITYRTSKNSSRSKKDIVTVDEQVISKGCQSNHNQEYLVNILIPSTSPPTDTTTSNICKVEYKIEVTAYMYGCHLDPTLDMPIFIGTIPFNNGNDISTSHQSGLQSANREQPMPMPMQMPVQMPVQMPMQMPVQMPMQMPMQMQMQIQMPMQMPVQTPMQMPMQMPMQTPMQAPMQMPMQMPMQTPMQMPMQTPMQTPMQMPMQTPMQMMPMQTPMQMPIQMPMPTTTQRSNITSPSAPHF